MLRVRCVPNCPCEWSAWQAPNPKGRLRWLERLALAGERGGARVRPYALRLPSVCTRTCHTGPGPSCGSPVFLRPRRRTGAGDDHPGTARGSRLAGRYCAARRFEVRASVRQVKRAQRSERGKISNRTNRSDHASLHIMIVSHIALRSQPTTHAKKLCARIRAARTRVFVIRAVRRTPTLRITPSE